MDKIKRTGITETIKRFEDEKQQLHNDCLNLTNQYKGKLFNEKTFRELVDLLYNKEYNNQIIWENIDNEKEISNCTHFEAVKHTLNSYKKYRDFYIHRIYLEDTKGLYKKRPTSSLKRLIFKVDLVEEESWD